MQPRKEIAPRPRVAPAYQPGTGTRDAVADLADWLTDTQFGTTTGFGGETLVAVRKSLLLGDDSYTRGAYLLVCRLRERNSQTFGRDIPANHVDCGREFRAVLESLQDALLGRMEERGRGRA